MRKFATAVVAGGLFFGGMGVAVADASWRDLSVSTTGAVFTGEYRWEAQSRNHGGFHVRGRLSDDDHADGHNSYLRAKVAGYGWHHIKGAQKKTVIVDKVFFDGSALQTNNAEVQLCRDRGTLRPDNCSGIRKFRR
ncbi:hypothetical protein ACIQHY_04505 [Streptomyces sp. NPDC092359]|uniref:hypothetical protein n=1 Tax=Streptomyces sp. NPDC092359 TaxID=3366014 RepID=UPI0038217AC1